MAPSAFAGLVEELLQPVGPVEVRRMFSGHGVFLDGVMFALISDDVLYLKSDDETRGDFDAAGLEPFTFVRQGRTMTTSYRRAPEPLERWEALEPWVRGAVAASRRAAAAKPRRRRR